MSAQKRKCCIALDNINGNLYISVGEKMSEWWKWNVLTLRREAKQSKPDTYSLTFIKLFSPQTVLTWRQERNPEELINAMNHKKYHAKDITPQTRLIDLVEKKYHPQLKQMIEELRAFTTLDGQTEWWRVNKLEFKQKHYQPNYLPIARFIWATTRNGNKGLKCSINTFFRYLTSSGHSNLNLKWNSAKTLIFSRIEYETSKQKW